jgi:hypothetical protein
MLYPRRQGNLDLHELDEKGTIVETSHVPLRYDADLTSHTATPAATRIQHHSTGARSEWAYRPLYVPELFMMQSVTTPEATALSAGEWALSYHFARDLGPDQPFYALDPYKLDDLSVPPSIEEITATHVEAVRAIQPDGPNLLGGFCHGGLVAYEMREMR